MTSDNARSGEHWGQALAIRLLTWNIRFGGRKKRAEILEAITQIRPDVIAFSEWLPGPDSQTHELDVLLTQAGFPHHVMPGAPPPGDYGSMLASRWPMEPLSTGPTGMNHRWAHGGVQTPEGDLEMIAVYVPTGGRDGGKSKNAYLQWLLESSPALLGRGPVVITGDFNCDHADDTGQFSPRLVQNRLFDQLFDVGWRDLYRELHAPRLSASWWSNRGRGFRLDHVLGGPAGPVATRVAYLDDSGESVGTTAPQRRLSDHVIVLSELVLG